MTTGDGAADSLVAAMAKARIPEENHDFIRMPAAGAGIADYCAAAESQP